MFKKTIIDGNNIVIGQFDKSFENQNYEVYFNTQTGLEVLKGKNGKDPLKTDLPLLIDVGIMGTCINSCDMCYQGRIKEDNMTLENFKNIIDQIKYLTNQVALGGRGDPNLHPQFKEILEYSRKNKVVPNYTTSGNGLTDEQIEISKLCGVVAVSDYSTTFTYDAIKRFMDAGIKTNIHLIFSKPNYNMIMEILNGKNPWLDKVDITKLNAVLFLLFKPQGEGRNLTNISPTKYQLKTFAENIFESKSDFKIAVDSCLMNYIMHYVDIPNEQKLFTDSCESSRMSAYISPSMKLIPCSFSDHSEWGVQISKENDIYNIWNNSKKFKKFRSIIYKKSTSCPIGF